MSAERQEIAAITASVGKFLRLESAAIQPNECTRLHVALEALADGRVYEGKTCFQANEDTALLLSCQPFVLKHDWLALLGQGFDPWDVGNDFRIPFPITAFEFMVNGRVVILLCIQPEGEPITMTSLVKWGNDWIFPSVADADKPDNHVIQMCWDQVRAACVAMDVGVAVVDERPAPAKLNAKRERNGHAPIPDLRVVNIATKHKRGNGVGKGEASKKRLHFRRGHWRHLEERKTWIKWMLVGDPELGLVEHHYKL